MSREQCGEYEYQCLRVLKVKSQMELRENPHNSIKTHIAGPPFATFMTEIFICILVFQWDAGGNGGNYFS